MLDLRRVSWFGAMQQAETGRSRPGEAEIGGGYKEDPCLLSREKKNVILWYTSQFFKLY